MNKLLDFIFPCRVAWRNVDTAIKIANDWKEVALKWEEVALKWEHFYNEAAETRDHAIDLVERINSDWEKRLGHK
jgi:hypothetical protein